MLWRERAAPAGDGPAAEASPLMMSRLDQPVAFAPTTRRDVRRWKAWRLSGAGSSKRERSVSQRAVRFLSDLTHR